MRQLQRELRGLGINLNMIESNNTLKSTEAGTNGRTGAMESLYFIYLDNINPSVVEGRELFLVVTTELSTDKKIAVSISNSY